MRLIHRKNVIQSFEVSPLRGLMFLFITFATNVSPLPYQEGKATRLVYRSNVVHSFEVSLLRGMGIGMINLIYYYVVLFHSTFRWVGFQTLVFMPLRYFMKPRRRAKFIV